LDLQNAVEYISPIPLLWICWGEGP